MRWWLVAPATGLLLLWFIVPPRGWQRRLARGGAILAIGAVVIGLCCVVRGVLIPEPLPDSVWMPRYLGFVLPAMLIGVAALLMRLPTRPLRWSVIALFIAVNLAQHWARVFAGSEAPTEQIVRDVLASQPPGEETRCVYELSYGDLYGPGTGLIRTMPARYYLAIYTGKPVSPRSLFFPGFEEQFTVWSDSSFGFGRSITRQVRASPKLRRIIAWHRLEPGEAVPANDELQPRLGAEWKMISHQMYHAREHWSWRDLYVARRRVYQRVIENPSTSQ
jgi:hypothetical protein